MVAVKKNQPATIQNTNKSVRRSKVVERSRSAVLNPMRRFLTRGGCLDTFVISKASTQKEDQAVVAQACFFASSFSAVSHMGRGHQLVGVWPESPASAKIKTAKISSKESACFSAKICTSENFLLHGMCVCVCVWGGGGVGKGVWGVMI